VLRVRSLGRRRRGHPPVLRRGDVVMDTLRHRVTRAGRLVPLSAREHAVLEVLLARMGSGEP